MVLRLSPHKPEKQNVLFHMGINGRVLKCLERMLEQRTKDNALTLVLQPLCEKTNKYVNHYISQVFSIHKILINFESTKIE